MTKITDKNEVINTSESVKEIKADQQLQAENFKKAQSISKSPRKKFKCSSIYATLYPDGFISTYQGIIIQINFDNSEIELPEPIIKYVEDKIQRKADTEAAKLNRFEVKKQEKIGDYSASE